MGSVELERDDMLQLREKLSLLQSGTNADLVLLGELLTMPVVRIRTLCCRIDQTWQPNFSYLLDSHPCKKVLDTLAFQSWDNAPAEFPSAFLLTDNKMKAYAACPVTLDSGQSSGILVVMSRTGWGDRDLLQRRLADVANTCIPQHSTFYDAIKRVRLFENDHIRDEFFSEFVLDNPAGVSFSEYMPPVPVDLPEPELIQRLLYTSYVVECNRAIARMYGYADTSGMMGIRAIDGYGPEKGPRNIAYWMRSNYQLRDVESHSVDGEGNITWIRGSAIGKVHDGKLVSFWIKRSDITAQKRYEAAIEHKAHHDALTALPNRYWFQDRITELIKDHAERGKKLCIGLLDLNGFKEVNDTLGHAVGDLILQAVAKRLLKGLKPHGADVARLGGDEFAILMPEVADREHGEAMAVTVQKLLAEPFEVEDMQLLVGGSLGLTMFPERFDKDDDLLRLADVAMYAAKNMGQAYRWYHPDIDKHSKRRLSLLTSLGTAIENNELLLHYQPKIDTVGGRTVGFEALVRWQHPVHGLIMPNDFIPYAETSEVIRPLTRWVLNDAIRQGAEWLRKGRALEMAVNISVRNLLDEQLQPYILECLGRHAFPAELLELEITESALMTHPAQSMEILHALRAHGISIAIDDFGTGYSSLAYLARLPVTTLKVDQTFVRKMVQSQSDEQIVRSVIGLAHQCKLSVVAEGVEDGQTLDALRAMDCDLVQGYFIARPMSASAASDWMDIGHHHLENFSSPQGHPAEPGARISATLRGR